VPIDAAIILAAGRGERLSAVSSTPKPLLSLSGRAGDSCFLDMHLRSLAHHGVKEVVIVGNATTARAPLRSILQLAGKLNVRMVVNPTDDLSTSGSAHSLWHAMHHASGLLDGQRRVVFMDADVVYDDDVFARLAAADPRRSATLVAARVDDNAVDKVVVWADPHAPHNAVRHGARLRGTPLVDGLTAVGEATGIVLMAPGDHARFVGITDWVIANSSAGTRSAHEDITQAMMTLDLVDVVALDAATTFFAVDTPADYEQLTTKVWPEVVQRRAMSMPTMTLPPTPVSLPPMPVR
jgi:choline kinase